MKYKKEFKQDHPETIGETDYTFDLANYTEWLEKKYEELQKQLSINGVVNPKGEKTFYCQDESYHRIDRCNKQCAMCREMAESL